MNEAAKCTYIGIPEKVYLSDTWAEKEGWELFNQMNSEMKSFLGLLKKTWKGAVQKQAWPIRMEYKR